MRMAFRPSVTALNTLSLEEGLCESGIEDALIGVWEQV